MKYLLTLFLASLCVGCNPTDKRATKSVQPETEQQLEQWTVSKAKADTAAVDRATGLGRDTLAVIDDDFVSQVFDKFLLYKNVIKNRRSFQLRQQTEPSDNPQITDTINTFLDRPNSFTYLQSGDPTANSALLIKARIESSTVKLPKNIKVGMSKAAFAAVFRLRAVPAVVVLAETEGYQRFTFTFANEVLVSVEFESSYMG
jgi:hypothetical protein